MGIIAKQSFKGTVVNYLGVFIGFLTTFFVLTRFLSPEEIGLTRVLIDAATIFISLAGLGTTSSIVRFYPYFLDKNNNCHGFFFLTTLIPFVGFILFSFLYWALHVPIQQFFAEKSPLFVNYYYFVLPIAFFLLYQTTFETQANVLMRIVFPKFVREVLTRILLLAAYLLYAFRILSMDGFVIAICAVYAIAALSNLLYLCCIGKISFRPDFSYLNRKIVLQWAAYSSFLLLSACVSMLGPTISGFFVTAKLGLDQTGIFAIATYIAVMVSIPYRSLSAIVQPELSKASKNKDIFKLNTLTKQSASVMMWIAVLILSLIWINIDVIFALLPNGSIYAPARYVVLLLGISNLLTGTFILSSTVLSFSPYYYLSLFFSLLLAAATVTLNNYLVPLLGINGAAITTCASNALYIFALLLFVRLKLKVSLFSKALWKVLALAIAGVLLNELLTFLLAGFNLYISAALRTIVIVGGMFFFSYFVNLVPEITAFINNFCRRLASKIHR